MVPSLAFHVDAEGRGVGQLDGRGRIVGHHLVLSRDLVGHHPALAHVLQHEPEAELLAQPQHGHDVVGAVGVVVHHAGAVQHLQQHLQPQVALGAGLAALRRALLLGAIAGHDERDSTSAPVPEAPVE